MARLYFFSVVSLLLSTALSGQAGNDECASALPLPEELTYCSGAQAFSNELGSPSLDPAAYPICLDETGEIKDVLFSFVAQRNAVSIRIAGDVSGDSRGSLRQPQMALFGGACGSLEELACQSPVSINGTLENGASLIYAGLNRGETYRILVGARNGNGGTFELCVDQFDAPPSPSSDCGTGVVLCDKSPFSVEFLQGNGMVNDDLLNIDGACPGRVIEEYNSAWYKWTCERSGSLTFDITPLGSNPGEDIDFVVYELTNGTDDCGARQTLRQMFSGPNRGDNPDPFELCLGKTGLREDDPDGTEGCGCTLGNNNFARAIEMEAGKSYALVIMNDTPSGAGFSIDFGGSGTFLGPEPNLTYSTTEACVGETVTFADQSTSVDGIDSWEWDFGVTATPRFASGAGPHDVSFNEAGTPNVTLAITSTRNCIEYISRNEVEVVCCADQFEASAAVTPVSCPAAADGAIDLTASSNVDGTTLTYTWSTGATTASISGLDAGTYSVTVTDGTGCEASYGYTVDGPAEFLLDTLVTRPTCGGGTDGALQFTILSGGAGGYEYSFNGGPFSTDNQIENLAISSVNVVARDANGCTVENDLLVDELRLELVTGSATFTEPTCTGDTDGAITIELANGLPAYRYDFGGGLQDQRTLGGFGAGDYTVGAIDANGCTGTFAITITEPPPLTATLASDSSSCFGAADGYVAVLPDGGRPDYTFSWDNGATADSLSDLGPGTFTVSVTDANGCVITDAVTLNDPDEIVAAVDSIENLICFGQATGAVRLTATGGSPAYTYSSDGVNFGSAPRLDSLLAGDYDLVVRDQNGCVDTVGATLTEPEVFIITAEDFVQLYLGDDTTLLAVSNYFPVQFSWGPDSVACLTPDCARVRIRPVDSGDYFVAGTNAAGCLDTATVAFSVIQDLPTFIPNVFSPNGDGSNDFFTVFGSNAIERVESLRIYDRWGGLLYESAEPFPANDPGLGWDGRLGDGRVNNGVYVYYVEVRYINGSVQGYRGDVTVLQ